MIETRRARLGWAVQWRCGSLLDDCIRQFLAGEHLGSDRPHGLVAAWPALVFETREDAREFVRLRFGGEGDPHADAGWRRPRIVRARAIVEVLERVDQEAAL